MNWSPVLRVSAEFKSGVGLAVRFECLGCAHQHRLLVGDNCQHQWNGDLESPTISPSIMVLSNSIVVCHSFVNHGRISYLSDCKHALAGKTVDLPVVNEFTLQDARAMLQTYPFHLKDIYVSDQTKTSH